MDKFEDFQKKYPNLFRIHPRSGFDLRPGWEAIVHSLCGVIERQILKLPEEIRADMHCAQVKEKFGTLRFYMTYENDAISAAISVAESISHKTCETCGKPGTLRQGGWLLTLCDEHHEEEQKHREEINKKYAEELVAKDEEDDKNA